MGDCVTLQYPHVKTKARSVYRLMWHDAVMSVDVLQLPPISFHDGAWLDGVRLDSLRMLLFGSILLTFGRRAGV